MLILSRKSGEEVTISERQTFHEHTYFGPKVVLKILSIQGNRVKLGFEGPESMVVLRSEITSKPADQ